MNILLTGCAGFIGSNLADKLLLNENNNIIGIDNFDNYYNVEIKKNNLSNAIKNQNFKLLKGDICDREFLKSVFEICTFDVVIHLAAKAGVRSSFQFPEEYTRVNVQGTKNILDSMREFSVKKIVFASSSSVYGNCEAEKFSENIENLVPISPYAETKLISENDIKKYALKYGIQAVCLRFFTVYGKRQRPDLAISKFSNAILDDKVVTMYGDGSTYRDYTHISDIVNAIISAVKYDKTLFEIFNIGSSNPIRLSKLVLLLEETIGKKAKIEHLNNQKGDVKKTYADITKAKKLLKYQPKIDFKDGLRDFVMNLI